MCAIYFHYDLCNVQRHTLTKSQHILDCDGVSLLAPVAAEGEVSVMAHTGLSISYGRIIENVRLLSKEEVDNFRKVIRESMCLGFVVWDNINAAFRIASGRLASKKSLRGWDICDIAQVLQPLHWEVINPSRHSFFAYETTWHQPRRTTDLVFDCPPEDVLSSSSDAAEELETCSLWYLKSVAAQHLPGLLRFQSSLGGYPTVDVIQIHKTEQFTLPATMYVNESSIDGTIDVYDTICKQLGLDDEFVEKYNIFFTHGDLLTDSLINRVCLSHTNYALATDVSYRSYFNTLILTAHPTNLPNCPPLHMQRSCSALVCMHIALCWSEAPGP
jgi:hypothetical protein